MRYKLCRVLVFCFVFFACAPSWAQQYDVSYFARIPILHEGRIKPMESFARAMLKTFSGKDRHAMPWLIETVFNPAAAEKMPVLKIRNIEVVNMLGLERRKNRLYSHEDVVRALTEKNEITDSIVKTPEETWTPAQRDLIVLQQNTMTLSDLLGSLSLYLPLSTVLPDDVPADLQPYAGQSLTYMDALKFRETLQRHLKQVIQNKGEDINHYTEMEQGLAYLAFSTDNLQAMGVRSRIFRVIPAAQQGLWRSPWDVISSGSGRPETSTLFRNWADLVAAYHDHDVEGWAKLSGQIYQETILLGGSGLDLNRLQAERIYNVFKPFYLSFYIYAFVLLFLGIHLYIPVGKFLRLAPVGLAVGAFMHSSGIMLRMYILQRPPVSTLYESILFVGLVAVVYGIWVYSRDKNMFWLYLSAGIGTILHILGFSQDQSGDNFLMLTAVLNTNFWLATHVICITLGYAFCLLASSVSHYALLKMVYQKKEAPEPSLFRHIHTVALSALLFSAAGTVLGGIWADQSWGRFWGWDPKENGALLIVLWLVWLLHGRISGQMKAVFVTAGLAYVSVIVALSWFGVNLLSVGLHSYGFTDSMVWALGLFVGVETVFILTVLWLVHRKRGIPYAN